MTFRLRLVLFLEYVCLGTYKEGSNLAKLLGVGGQYHRYQKVTDKYYLDLENV